MCMLLLHQGIKKARKNLAAQLPSFWNYIITSFPKPQGRWLIQGHDIFASKVFSKKRGMLQRLHLLVCSHDDSTKRKEDGEPCTGSENVCPEVMHVSSHSNGPNKSHGHVNFKGSGKIQQYHVPFFEGPLQGKRCWISPCYSQAW